MSDSISGVATTTAKSARNAATRWSRRLRKTYGPDFAPGVRGDTRLDTLREREGGESLSKLVKDARAVEAVDEYARSARAGRSLSAPAITHADIADFAAESVNLNREDAEEYREQVRRLREKLDKYAADHPDYGLIKTLLSGSLAKGTALKTLNDIDVAFYVKAEKAPAQSRICWSGWRKRLREAYPQMKPDQIKPNNHSVCIKYAVSGLSVDVVPVQYKGDPDDRGYLFAFDGGKPVLTSIPLHLAFIRKRKAQQKDHFAQVIRLVKWWVRLQKINDEEFRLKSFMTEMIVSHLADSGVSMADYTVALEKVFSLHREVAAQDADLFHGLLSGIEAAGADRKSDGNIRSRQRNEQCGGGSMTIATGRKL